MKISPLQLKSYHFNKITIEAQDRVEIDHTNTIEVNVECGYAVDNERDCRIIFTVNLTNKNGGNPPYLGTMEVIGFFQIHDDWPKEKIDLLLSVSGQSLLFGVVREMFMNITSRSKHGMGILPTLNFQPTKESAEQDSPQKPKSASKKKKPAKNSIKKTQL